MVPVIITIPGTVITIIRALSPMVMACITARILVGASPLGSAMDGCPLGWAGVVLLTVVGEPAATGMATVVVTGMVTTGAIVMDITVGLLLAIVPGTVPDSAIITVTKTAKTV